MTSVSPSKSLLSGALFGSALTVAGMFAPGIIMGQLRLENFHMLKTFLMASATSGIIILLAQTLHLTTCKPRQPNSLSLFSKYDGNIIGGTLLGIGLALTGACPGTVLPQVGTGVPSGPFVLFGGILGGAFYALFRSHFPQFQPKPLTTNDELSNPTVHEALGISRNFGIGLFVTLCSLATGVASLYAPSTTPLLIPVIIGGLLIGLSQGANIYLTGNTLGISVAYEQTGSILIWSFQRIFSPSALEKTATPKLTTPNIIFALGTTLGSYAINQFIHLSQNQSQTNDVVKSIGIGKWRALIGGVIMIFGSRLAGGCTSGHGISGMSQLSISSVISVAAMFAGGIGLTAVLL